jgi:hypothetical protein
MRARREEESEKKLKNTAKSAKTKPSSQQQKTRDEMTRKYGAR